MRLFSIFAILFASVVLTVLAAPVAELQPRGLSAAVDAITDIAKTKLSSSSYNIGLKAAAKPGNTIDQVGDNALTALDQAATKGDTSAISALKKLAANSNPYIVNDPSSTSATARNIYNNVSSLGSGQSALSRIISAFKNP